MQTLHRIHTESLTGHPVVAHIGRHVRLDPADTRALGGILQTQLIKKQSDIIVEGAKYRRLGFVEVGVAAQYKVLRNGKRQILNLLLPGDVIGLIDCFHERAIFSVMAMTELKVQTCSFESFLRLTSNNYKVQTALLWLLAEQASIFAEHILTTGRRTPLEKLIYFLLEMYSRLEQLGRVQDGRFELSLSQDTIADALGLSAPEVNRLFKRLRSDGLIVVNGHEVTLTDIEALEGLVSFERLHMTPAPIRT